MENDGDDKHSKGKEQIEITEGGGNRKSRRERLMGNLEDHEVFN